MHTKTVKIRIKDSNAKKALKELSRSVNFVWNYCNEISFHALRNYSKWLSGFDLNKLTAGSGKDLGLHSQSVQAVCEEYALKRRQFKKRKLRWRSKRSLGWVPFKKSGIKIKDGCLIYQKKSYRLFQPERLPSTEGSGQFVEDARGRWYVCISVKCEDIESFAESEVGIDLGLKNLATLSSGKKIDNNRYFRMMEKRLASAQRAKKKRLIKSRHAKIRNQRLDFLHKESTKIADENRLIVIGKLNVQALKKTRMAKSFSDAGTAMFKDMLKYKSKARKHVFVEVSETNTTRTCSACGKIPSSAPKGVKGLSVREWVCGICHAILDRDVNASINILRLGHQALASEVS